MQNQRLLIERLQRPIWEATWAVSRSFFPPPPEDVDVTPFAYSGE